MARPFLALDEKLAPWQILVYGLQHVLAMFVGIVTPPLIIAGSLGLSHQETGFLVSAALLTSGLATFIQVHRLGPFGSGMLSVQGTSFTFVELAIQSGKIGGLPLIFGLTIACAPVEMVVSRFLGAARRWFPPLVTGTVVMLIGFSLIGVGMTDLAGGFGAQDFGAPGNLALGLFVLVLILVLSRLGPLGTVSIAAGLVIGYLVAALLGRVDFSPVGQAQWLEVPRPLAHGLAFDPVFLLPWMLAYVVSSMETIGDLTATSQVSRQPVEGPVFTERIQGGVAADGLGSMLAGLLNSMPNTTFSQNNGVIQLTGVAARSAGYGVAALLVAMALFPKLGAVLSVMPKPVLGGATVVMFATVAVAGIRIATSTGLDPRKELILAISLALGLGVIFVPEAFAALEKSGVPLVRSLGVVAQSGLAVGGITALVLNRLIPEPESSGAGSNREG